MFTVRFSKHNNTGYKSFPVVSYEVTRKPDDTFVHMELASGEICCEHIGGAAPWSIAYVTNQSGRTIDTIRP